MKKMTLKEARRKKSIIDTFLRNNEFSIIGPKNTTDFQLILRNLQEKMEDISFSSFKKMVDTLDFQLETIDRFGGKNNCQIFVCSIIDDAIITWTLYDDYCLENKINISSNI